MNNSLEIIIQSAAVLRVNQNAFAQYASRKYKWKTILIMKVFWWKIKENGFIRDNGAFGSEKRLDFRVGYCDSAGCFAFPWTFKWCRTCEGFVSVKYAFSCCKLCSLNASKRIPWYRGKTLCPQSETRSQLPTGIFNFYHIRFFSNEIWLNILSMLHGQVFIIKSQTFTFKFQSNNHIFYELYL